MGFVTFVADVVQVFHFYLILDLIFFEFQFGFNVHLNNAKKFCKKKNNAKKENNDNNLTDFKEFF